ncbi:hypothetical protein SAMN04488168_102172 [Bacillus sp. 491mf]|uniref:hypothetical protein n=1 Tax=Bacillus sp. 491mf TaxID=1761755 RepID=UPI0008EC50D2|nr:hypothetical protein [Bacillus sp. 491mf]SFC14344.1 hypothetical protein SAMN04488168_102172 [Bacillus sp. 491mf]
MKQELQAVAELQEAKETFIDRIFSVVGSGIFFIGHTPFLFCIPKVYQTRTYVSIYILKKAENILRFF